MKKISRRAWLGICGAATVAGGLLEWPPRHKVSWASTLPREVIRERYFPNFLLTTHEGEQVRFYDDLIKDKFVTINFIYTSCKVTCPLITANLVRVQEILGERIGRNLFMYSITLDPEHDTPEVLKKYAKTHGVGPGWQFLTGKPEEIEMLRRKLGFTWADPVRDANKDNHTGNLRYGNEPLMWWGAVPGMANPRWIAKCILFADWPKNTQASQSRGSIGS
jgi:protein SCO1